jgi:hypothetical protein
MKAKLINTNVNYLLEDDKGVIIASTSTKEGNNKLSKQNCDEIFGVVNVEKLAIEYDLYEKINFVGQTRAYKAGLQKAMELNKDKLFTLKDIKKAMDWMMTQYFEFHEQPTIGRRDQYLESIQQPTEIEVEIVTVPALSNNGNVYYGDIPKLDSNRCLILKIKE